MAKLTAPSVFVFVSDNKRIGDRTILSDLEIRQENKVLDLINKRTFLKQLFRLFLS